MKRYDPSTVKAVKGILGEVSTLKGVSIVLALILSFAWIPDGISNLVGDKLSARHLGVLQSAVGVLILASVFFYIRKFSKEKVRYRIDQVEKRDFKVVILPLSEAGELPRGKSQEELEKHRWIQPYRAIKQIIEKGKLEKVIVVGSGGNKSSYEQFHEFKEFIINLIPEASRIKIELWEKPVDFHNLEEIHAEFERIYEKLSEEGYKDSDIVLDVTGGTKPVSIAGAATTTPFIDRYFQYVTNEGKLLVFNIEPYS